MRIVGGQYRGLTLKAPQDQSIRPTSDKARQAIFNTLLSGKFGIHLDGAIVMDGTAGSGAMGIEALSRGAKHVHFIDPNPQAMRLVRGNLEALGIDPSSFTLHAGAVQDLSPHSGAPCALVFLDPPYRSGLIPAMVAHLRRSGWSDQDTWLVIEEDAKAALALDLDIEDRKSYGAAQILYCRYPA